MHKKLLIGLIAVSMAFTALFGFAACGSRRHVHEYDTDNICTKCGEEWEYTEKLEYELNDDGKSYSVGKNKDVTGDVAIPYYHNGKPVTGINRVAFYHCSEMTSIVMPDSITSIGDRAFMGCSGLTCVVISDSATSIGEWAFYDCSGLTSIYIPARVTSIGERAFYRCSGLTSVEISHSVTSIGGSAFFGCKGLTNIVIPNSVTSMGSMVFDYCENLTIYCEAKSQPSGWSSIWNTNLWSEICPVVWGYKG